MTTCTRLVFFATLLACLLGASAARAEEPPAFPAPPAPPADSVVGGAGGGTSVGWCAPPSCCPPPCCDPCRGPSLDLQIHGAWVNGLEGPLTVPSSAADQVVWDPLDYGMSLGGRVAYHWAWGRHTATVGGTYWGAWEDEHTTLGTLAASDVPGGVPNISPVFTVQFEAQTRLYGVEADLSSDWVCTPCFRAGWGYGLRYMRFEEEGTFTFIQGGPPPSQGHADVDNSLLAAQLCAHAAWRLGDRLELRARGAAFAGWLRQQVEVTSSNFIPPGPDAEDDSFGFGGELEIEARWRLRCNWSLGVGYGLLVLFDQARAEQAFDLSQTNTGVAPGRIDEDTIFAHRVFVGVTFDF